MELLYDEHGQPRIEDGKPVYRREDGQEVAFDVPAAMQKIHLLNSEAKTHRLRADELLERFKAVEDIEDLSTFRSAAEKALEKAGLLDSGNYMPKEEAERLREEALAELREELRAATKEKAQYKALAAKEAISGVFGRSEFLKRRVNLPTEAVMALLKGHFRFQNGKVLAYDCGNLLYGGKGEPATAEEALEVLLMSRFPDFADARVWKASGGGGSDSGQNLPQAHGLLSMTLQQARDVRQYRRRKDEAGRTGRPLVITS